MTLSTYPVGQFMTPTPETIEVTCSISDALERMQRLNLRHLPVMDGPKLVGIVSDRDLCIAKVAHGIDPTDIGVNEVMTRDLYAVGPEAPLEETCKAMVEGRFGSTLVVEGGKVVGIFTTTDALRVLIESAGSEQQPYA